MTIGIPPQTTGSVLPTFEESTESINLQIPPDSVTLSVLFRRRLPSLSLLRS